MVKNMYTLTLLKSFDILNCFNNDRQELGIKEISEKIGMPQSSIYHIINSLEFIGLVFQNKETRKYRIGPQFLELSQKCNCLDSYMQICTNHMKELEAETGENINLAIANCDQVLLVHRVECNHVLRPNFPLNTPFPAYKTGLGMVFLAEKSKASLEWIYENNQPNIGISLDEFIMRAKKDREAGYAFDDQLFCPGLRCIAAPISGPGGLVMFSLSVSGPATRMDDETCQKIQKLAVKYAHIMSNEILALG